MAVALSKGSSLSLVGVGSSDLRRVLLCSFLKMYSNVVTTFLVWFSKSYEYGHA